MRYKIADIKNGIAKGSISCGPIPGPIVSEVKFESDKGTTFYTSLTEVEGTPMFFRTEESYYVGQVEEDYGEKDEEEFYSELNAHSIGDFCDYEELFFALHYGEDQDEMFEIYKLLVYLVRSDWDETDDFSRKVVGRWLDEIIIPRTDLEMEYLEEINNMEL